MTLTPSVCASPPSAYRCHRPGRHPGGREGGGEELRQLARHAGGLHGHGRAAGDSLPAVQGGAGTAGTARAVSQPERCHTPSGVTPRAVTLTARGSLSLSPIPQCVNELNQWLSALRKVCGNNPRLLRSYHPGVFRGDKWSCCHQRDRTGTGRWPRSPSGVLGGSPCMVTLLPRRVGMRSDPARRHPAGLE